MASIKTLLRRERFTKLIFANRSFGPEKLNLQTVSWINMKKIIAIVSAALLLAAACKQTPSVPATDAAGQTADATALVTAPADTVTYDTTTFTTIEWIDPIEKELGKLVPGKEIEITWRFRNSGQRPLIIENVGATCGCTIPEKPEQPFAPGQTGTIRAKFNGSGSGFILKQVFVTANTKPSREHTLVFKAEVTDKK
jgi:hypothetical protein